RRAGRDQRRPEGGKESWNDRQQDFGVYEESARADPGAGRADAKTDEAARGGDRVTELVEHRQIGDDQAGGVVDGNLVDHAGAHVGHGDVSDAGPSLHRRAVDRTDTAGGCRTVVMTPLALQSE